MKKHTTLTTLVITALAITSLFATEQPISEAAKFEWQKPGTFSDVGESGQNYSEDLFKSFRSEFEYFVEKKAEANLPENYQLSLIVKDVDLAGEFEPWAIATQDIRIMREIYPPRLKFHYEIHDETGELVKRGTAQLTDTSYLWNLPISISFDDTFYHEKELIERWLDRVLTDVS